MGTPRLPGSARRIAMLVLALVGALVLARATQALVLAGMMSLSSKLDTIARSITHARTQALGPGRRLTLGRGAEDGQAGFMLPSTSSDDPPE